MLFVLLTLHRTPYSWPRIITSCGSVDVNKGHTLIDDVITFSVKSYAASGGKTTSRSMRRQYTQVTRYQIPLTLLVDTLGWSLSASILAAKMCQVVLDDMEVR